MDGRMGGNTLRKDGHYAVAATKIFAVLLRKGKGFAVPVMLLYKPNSVVRNTEE